MDNPTDKLDNEEFRKELKVKVSEDLGNTINNIVNVKRVKVKRNKKKRKKQKISIEAVKEELRSELMGE